MYHRCYALNNGECNREITIVSIIFGQTNTTVTMVTADLNRYKLCRAIEAVIDFNKAAGSDDSALEVVLGTTCIISR